MCSDLNNEPNKQVFSMGNSPECNGKCKDKLPPGDDGFTFAYCDRMDAGEPFWRQTKTCLSNKMGCWQCQQDQGNRTWWRRNFCREMKKDLKKPESELWVSELKNIITNFHWEHLQRNLKNTQYSLNSLKGSIIFLKCAEVLYSATV